MFFFFLSYSFILLLIDSFSSSLKEATCTDRSHLSSKIFSSNIKKVKNTEEKQFLTFIRYLCGFPGHVTSHYMQFLLAKDNAKAEDVSSMLVGNILQHSE